jgi:hypothetical protein
MRVQIVQIVAFFAGAGLPKDKGYPRRPAPGAVSRLGASCGNRREETEGESTMTEECRERPAGWWFAAAFGVIVAVALAMPGMARASSIADPDDVNGKLDVASVSQDHGATGPVTHTITTYGPWRSRVLGGSHMSYFVLEIDTAGNAQPERFAIVYRAHGVMRVAVTTRRGRLLGFGVATRANLRSVTLSIPRKLLGKPNGHHWKLYSVYVAPGACRTGCVDRAPNSGQALHDLAAPTLTFPTQGLPASTTTDVRFAVIDTGHSGLDTWTLQGRNVGDAAWTDIASGSVSVTRAEGDRREFQIVATDRAGNAATSRIRRINFPYDDGNAGMTYAGTWATTGADSLDYLGTLHTSGDTTTPATVSFTFQGSSVGVIARGSCGDATVSIDGGTAQPVTQLCGNEHRAIVFSAPADATASHILTVTVTGGTFDLDGIVVR